MSTLKRPSRHDTDTYALAGEAFLKKISWGEQSRDENINIGRALSESHAFERARELADQGFDINDDVMQTLLDGSFIDEALDALISEWVVKANVRPLRKLGDKVAVDRQGERLDGEVTGIDEKSAKYKIHVPALGHVKAGLGTHGLVIEFEKIHPLSRPVEDFELEPAM